MNKIAEIFPTLDYGPAPESAEPALAWLASHGNKFGHFIDGKWTKPGKTFASDNPANRQEARRHHRRHRRRCRQGSEGRPRRVPGWSALSGYERGKYLYAIARLVQKHCAPVRRAREHGQRQADPREPRHRHPAGRPPLLPSRRLGPAPRPRIPRHGALWRVRPDHPVEFPAADAGLEDRPGARRRQHRGAEAGRVHLADRAAVRRDRREGQAAAGRRQHRHRRGRHRRGDRRPSRYRQDRLHRLDRSRQDHPRRDRRHRQGAEPRARRQVALHRLRRRRSRQRHRRPGRCHLVQPGPGLLRRLAPPGPGIDRRALHRQAQEAHVDACASAIRSTRPSISARWSPRCRSSASAIW